MNTSSSSAKTKNRGALWRESEVQALVAVWGESDVQDELDGIVRNETVYGDISKKLAQMGVKRSSTQCRTKIKNLKTEYRKVKDNNSETGRGRQTMKFYKELDSILGHRPATVPTALLDTGTSTSTAGDSEQADSPEETETNDGEDVQAQSPIDGALIPEAGSSTGETPGDETAKPPSKKRRVEKKNRAERAIQTAVETFAKQQREAEERFLQYEEERWKRETELEDERRRQDREHEVRMMQMLGQMFQWRYPEYTPGPSTGMHYSDPDDYYYN